MGIVRDATEAKLAELTDPDVALSALALRLAELLDSEQGNAAAAKEYRATMNALTNKSKPSMSLDDLEDDDDELETGRWPRQPGPWGRAG